MTTQEALTYFKQRLDCGQCGKNTTQRFAFEEAIKALEIADRLENLDASHYISESRDWEYSYRSGFLNGYSQALADIRGDEDD